MITETNKVLSVLKGKVITFSHSTNSKHHFLLPHIMVRTFSPQYLLIRSEERMSVTTLVCGVICFICDVTSHFPPPETARFRDYGVTN